jgi:N-acetylgalactosamine kinase
VVVPGRGEVMWLFARRICRLYRFRDGEWRERGKGPAKILAHKETDLHRLVVREEKTNYVRANHVISPDYPLAAVATDAKTTRFTFQAADFADNESIKWETLMIRFKDEVDAAEFKKVHDSAREKNVAALERSAAASGTASASASAAPSAAAATAGSSVGDEAVPVVSSLAEAWGESDADARRIDSLTSVFIKEFGQSPEFFVHAPGRVNVIGEHVDYHDLPVLPFALSQDVVIAGCVDASGAVEVRNVDASYPAASLPADPAAPVERGESGLAWHHYVQAGYKAAFAAIPASAGRVGVKLLVDGRVPVGSGLSSSSALSVASCLATIHAHGATVTRSKLATISQEGERAVGTMSGGMDQAIAAMGARNTALKIEFAPLRATPVSLPSSVGFVVANSNVLSLKGVSAADRYNKRVTEGLLGCMLVAKAEGVAGWKDVHTVRALQTALGAASLSELVPKIESSLKGEAYSVADVEAAFGEPIAAAIASFPRKELALEVVASSDGSFALQKRLRHVASEADRVEAFAAACVGEHTAATVTELGRLMDESHASCRDDYECSCAELDQLVDIAKSAGAFGARLTGAGWGGCIVAMVEAGNELAVLDALDKDFYASMSAEARESARFATAPSSGVAVYVIDNEI